jgi:hypothetical protein
VVVQLCPVQPSHWHAGEHVSVPPIPHVAVALGVQALVFAGVEQTPFAGLQVPAM